MNGRLSCVKQAGTSPIATQTRAWLSLLTLVPLLGSVVGCRTAPIRNVLDAPLPPHHVVELEDVDEAIWRAGRKLGWAIERIRPGVLRGTLRIRRHLAVVSITHDGHVFSIRYEDSRNLLHEGDSIHRNYNIWVLQLAKKIQKEPIRPRARRPTTR